MSIHLICLQHIRHDAAHHMGLSGMADLCFLTRSQCVDEERMKSSERFSLLASESELSHAENVHKSHFITEDGNQITRFTLKGIISVCVHV